MIVETVGKELGPTCSTSAPHIDYNFLYTWYIFAYDFRNVVKCVANMCIIFVDLFVIRANVLAQLFPKNRRRVHRPTWMVSKSEQKTEVLKGAMSERGVIGSRVFRP